MLGFYGDHGFPNFLSQASGLQSDQHEYSYLINQHCSAKEVVNVNTHQYYRPFEGNVT